MYIYSRDKRIRNRIFGLIINKHYYKIHLSAKYAKIYTMLFDYRRINHTCKIKKNYLTFSSDFNQRKSSLDLSKKIFRQTALTCKHKGDCHITLISIARFF